MIQAYKIAENRDVLLPVMVCMDGFVLTHTVEPVEIPDSEAVSKFLPPFTLSYILDSANPITMGSLGDPSYYMELRRQQEDAMEKALEAVEEVDREFREAFGRGYGIIEEYNMEEAEVVLVTLGSVAGTIKEVIDTIGDKRVGLLKIRLFRPFPKEAVLRALAKAKVMSVIEKDVSTGLGEGALSSELKGILFNTSIRPRAMGFVVGLGGRDVTPENIEEIVEMSIGALEGKDMPEVTWIGLKEEQI